MSDRELLELAAKAAGMALWAAGDVWRDSPMGTGLLLANGRWVWNPLTHDGDALRLAVKLGLKIAVFNERMEPFTQVSKGGNFGKEEAHMDNPEKATRRAIVRAAAFIGKAMP